MLDVDIDNILIPSIVSSGKKIYKCFIGYKGNDYKIKALCIMLPKTSAYVKSYNCETKWMKFLIRYDNLLKNHNDIWNKVCNSIKKNLIARQ